jgi:hypothetical protein
LELPKYKCQQNLISNNQSPHYQEQTGKITQPKTTGTAGPPALCLLWLKGDRIYGALWAIFVGVAILLPRLPQCF